MDTGIDLMTRMHRFALLGLLSSLACRPATPISTSPGPQQVAETALAAAKAGNWRAAVLAMDPSFVESYRSAMLNASDFLVAVNPRIFAQADSISREEAAFYGRVNAINAAGGPLLPLLGARNLDELKALSPTDFVTRLLEHFDSAASGRDPSHATRTYSITGRVMIEDSVATLPLSLPGGALRALHLVRWSNGWWLSEDALFAFLTLASH